MKDIRDRSAEVRWFQRIWGPFPKLERGDRLELLNRIEMGADGGVDYVVMMVLSGSLASLGLIQGSAAVVIGAMLVAPLMGPLIGAGHALVQGNRVLFQKAVGVSFLGLGLGLAVSAFFGLLNPGFEPSLEIEARGTPDLLDLVIALASGMAAAYASGRPNVAGTLAGVAIAAALVPPLAVVGIGLTNGHLFIAGNASILLITNLVAIILGVAVVFRALGVQGADSRTGTPIWVRRATIGLLLITVLLIAPLLLQVLEKRRIGQPKPLTYPTTPNVRAAAKTYIDAWPQIELITMARTSYDPDAGITILLASGEEVGPEFEEGLRETVLEARGGKVEVRIFSLLSASRTSPGETPENMPEK
jgi:uncharacterized hydrophobic protein (TIGR00271 family)